MDDVVAVHKHVGDTPITKKALAFAIEKHAGQVRRGSGLPYVVHPIEVYTIVRKYKESRMIDELGAIAVLHDTLEDTKTTYEELLEKFGKMVADTVLEVTNDRAEVKRLGKQEYLEKKLAHLSSYALVVKMADMIANIGETPKPEAVDRIAHHCRFLEEGGWNGQLSQANKALLLELRRTLREMYGK